MQFLRTVIINLLVALGLLLAIDLLLTLPSFQRNVSSSALTCADSLTFYNYCPGVTQVRFMDKQDRLLPVYNFIGDDRHARYADSPPPVTQSGTVYLIGDSFIQADELPIEERLEHWFRLDGNKTRAFGYSSWNVHQFVRIAQTLPTQPGDRVFVFPMTNDFTPVYSRSTVRASAAPAQYPSDRPPPLSFAASYGEQSFLNQRIRPLMAGLFDRAAGSASGSGAERWLRRSHDAGNRNDCASLPAVDDLASPLAHNYVELSKASDCWSEPVRRSVDLNITLLQELVAQQRARGADVQIVLVGAGWTLPGQNSVGRTAPIYRFDPDIAVDQGGLHRYLLEHGLPVVDSTALLRKHATGRDNLYFAVDGHWTAQAHRILHAALAVAEQIPTTSNLN